MMECQRQQQSSFLQQQVNGGNGLHPRLFNPHHHHHSSGLGSFPRLPSAQNNVKDQEVPLLIRKIHFKLVAKTLAPLVFIKHSRICKHVEALNYRKTLKTEIILHKSGIYHLLMIEVLRQHV